MTNVSPAFIWLVTKDTDCALLRRQNGIGDLSTCAYNPVGTQRPRNSAFANKKHAGVVAHPSGEGFVLNHQGKRSANKPAKSFTSQHLSNLKSADVQNFRNFVQHRLGRRDLSANLNSLSVLRMQIMLTNRCFPALSRFSEQAVIRKANRIAFTQNRNKKHAKQPSPKKN